MPGRLRINKDNVVVYRVDFDTEIRMKMTVKRNECAGAENDPICIPAGAMSALLACAQASPRRRGVLPSTRPTLCPPVVCTARVVAGLRLLESFQHARAQVSRGLSRQR